MIHLQVASVKILLDAFKGDHRSEELSTFICNSRSGLASGFHFWCSVYATTTEFPIAAPSLNITPKTYRHIIMCLHFNEPL